MTELIIATLKLGIGDPHWQTIALSEHTAIYIRPERRTERIRARSKRPNPERLFELVANAIDGIPQPAIAMRILLNGPRLVDGRPEERLGL